MTDTIAPRPLTREPLHYQLVARLRQMIIEGAIAPGEKINERALCDRFGVSRTPLREAVTLLVAEGLIQVAPHRGATVTAITLSELEAGFPVMGALERLVGELAAVRASDGEIAAIRALHEDMLAHYRTRARAEYFRANEAIHDAILAAARNPVLEQASRSVAARLRRARFQANLTEERWAAAVAEHEAIIEALEARDAARLAVLLPAHLEAKHRAIRAALSAKHERPHEIVNES